MRTPTRTLIAAGADGIAVVGLAGCAAADVQEASGLGRTPTRGDVDEVHGFVRRTLVGRVGEAGAAIRIRYGGSVKPSNAAELLSVPEVGGALVGGASLKAADCVAICEAVRRADTIDA